MHTKPDTAPETPPDLWLDDPPSWTYETLYSGLRKAYAAGASDIKVCSGYPVVAKLHGRWVPVSRRELKLSEVENILDEIRMAGSSGQLRSGEDLDFAISVALPETGRKIRFRSNATAVLTAGRAGADIIFRALPTIPPAMADMQLPENLVNALFPTVGLVLVVGATGSGKTTLLGAAIRHILESIPGKHVLTYEAPIEFVYDDVPGKKSFISQTSIPDGLPSFARGIRNSLRRAPSIILVGEARDVETVGGTVLACQNGHAVYSTVHVNSVPLTITRMVGEFPAAERGSTALKILEALGLIVHQRLVARVGGGRPVAIREYLPFDAEIRNILYNEDWENWSHRLRQIMDERKLSLKFDLNEKIRAGLADPLAWRALSDMLSSKELSHLSSGGFLDVA